VAIVVEQATHARVAIDRSAKHVLIASWLGWMFDGYETYALILVMRVAVHQLLPSVSGARIYMAGLLSTTLLGWAIGGVIAGVLTDYIGRRRVLMLSILWYAAFAGLTALAWNYWSLLAFRFLTGLGLGAEWGPGSAIVAEFWPPSSRGRAGGALHAALGVGYFVASAIWLLVNPLGPSSWRYMFVLGVAPALFLVYVRRVVHDPAQWVAADDQRREARRRIEMGRATTRDIDLAQAPIARVLSDTGLRRRVGLLLLMSLSSVIGWWSVSTWVPLHLAEMATSIGQQRQHWESVAGLVFNAGSIAGYLTFGVLADRYGRKPSVCAYYVGALVCSLWFFLRVADTPAMLWAAAATGFFASGQFAWMTIYLPELFPTRVRGSAISVVFDGTRSIAAAGPLVAGWLASSFGGIGAAAAVMSLIYLVGLAVAPFAGPETKGTMLPT
jgi:MFS family permease